MEPPNPKFWTTIYPAYLNSKLKKSEGRKIHKSTAVENPTLQEISEVLSFLRLLHCVENKAYPRDILQRGRIKLETVLLKKLASYISRLKSRVNAEETKAEPKKKNKKKKNK